jgi:rhodanese-related sulfurtransferase
MNLKTITVADLFQLAETAGSKVNLIDVRERDEFAAVSSSLAKNFPLSELNPQSIAREFDLHQPLYVICKSGMRSARAAEVLSSSGFDTVINVSGGMLAWVNLGLPVKHGQ